MSKCAAQQTGPRNNAAARKIVNLAKALNAFFLVPSHKWDGNELIHHCRWLQPTDEKIYPNKALAKIVNLIYSISSRSR